MKIPFNKPTAVGTELANIADALARGHLAGDGYYTKRCHQWLEQRLGCKRALLTHSCTGALDMAAILCDLAPGDEVIMPSYTFVSTANAFALRGAVPVFVDVRADTLNRQIRAKRPSVSGGMRLANESSRVMMMLELLLVVSSVGLSVVLSRLAVGEMFRLVRIDRIPAPVPSRDDAR